MVRSKSLTKSMRMAAQSSFRRSSLAWKSTSSLTYATILRLLLQMLLSCLVVSRRSLVNCSLKSPSLTKSLVPELSSLFIISFLSSANTMLCLRTALPYTEITHHGTSSSRLSPSCSRNTRMRQPRLPSMRQSTLLRSSLPSLIRSTACNTTSSSAWQRSSL